MNTDANNTNLDIRREATVWELATIIAESRDFPDCRTPQKAAVRILAGREMGVGPVGSVIGIRVNAGRVSMDASLMAGLIERSPIYGYRITEHTDERCTLEFYRDGQPVGSSGFSLDDAKKAGLSGKDTWKHYPRNLLFARAMSNGARWFCAGIFGGSIYTHEELGYAVDAEGHAADEGGAASDLCTREQRQTITALLPQAGLTLPAVLAELGIKLLDELSSWEADKLVKKLEKKAAKTATAKPQQQEAAATTDRATVTDATEAPSPVPSQATIAEALQESGEPCTDEQRAKIVDLAQKLLPGDEDAQRSMLLAALAKRGKQRLAELSRLQAAGLIEAMEEKLSPPFAT